MSLYNFILIVSGVLLNAIAQLLIKAGTNALGQLNLSRSELLSTTLSVGLEPHILGGLTCYVFSVVIWIIVLSKVPVSVAYPMLSIGYVVNAIAAWYLFGEILSAQKIVGISTIIVGVFLIAKS